MSQIELKIPTDNPSALKRFGEALTGMGLDLEGGIPVEKIKEHLANQKDAERYSSTVEIPREDWEKLQTGQTVELSTGFTATKIKGVVMKHWLKGGELLVQCTAETFDELNRETYGQLTEDVSSDPTPPIDDGTIPPPPPENDHLDAEGLPWDGRIHSKNKTKIKSGKWKCRKCPKDVSGDEWAAFVAQVKTENREALAGKPIEQSTTVQLTPDTTIEDIQTVAQDALNEVVSELNAEQAFGDVPPPPPSDDVPPPPPSDDVPPPPPSGDVPPITFAQLMKVVTGNKDKGSIDKINTILNSHGIAKLPLLMTARPDLIPQVHAELTAMLLEE